MVYFRIGASVLIGKEFTLNGDGSLLRDFTYIDDVVKSVLLLERQLRIEPIGFADVINIGGGISVNN
jgi:UDP-glucuronate 4-epimerase